LIGLNRADKEKITNINSPLTDVKIDKNLLINIFKKSAEYSRSIPL